MRVVSAEGLGAGGNTLRWQNSGAEGSTQGRRPGQQLPLPAPSNHQLVLPSAQHSHLHVLLVPRLHAGVDEAGVDGEVGGDAQLRHAVKDLAGGGSVAGLCIAVEQGAAGSLRGLYLCRRAGKRCRWQ